MIRSVISSYPDMRAAVAALYALEAEYLKTNKHKVSVDLTVSSSSQPFYDDRGRARMGQETIELNAWYDAKDAGQSAEIAWLKTQAKEMT